MQCNKLEGHKLSPFYFVKSGTEKVPIKQRKKGGNAAAKSGSSNIDNIVYYIGIEDK